MQNGKVGINMFANVYKDKKVLVTGHTGFKGSWLVAWLEMLGAEVTGYSRESDTTPNHIGLLQTNSKSIIGDVCDLEHLQSVVDEFKPEIVFHLAAQSLVRRSYRDPVDTYQTNVMGTLNVLLACEKSESVKCVISTTSQVCNH